MAEPVPTAVAPTTHPNPTLTNSATNSSLQLIDNAKTSALLRDLPGEIRIMIWRFSLERETYNCEESLVSGTPAYEMTGQESEPTATSLLRTCRQLYAEARPLFAPTVNVRVRELRLNTFFSFQSHLVPKARLRSLTISTECVVCAADFEDMIGKPISSRPELKHLEIHEDLPFSLAASHYVGPSSAPEDLETIANKLVEATNEEWQDLQEPARKVADRLSTETVASFQVRDGITYLDGGQISYRPAKSRVTVKASCWIINCMAVDTVEQGEYSRLNMVKGTVRYSRDNGYSAP